MPQLCVHNWDFLHLVGSIYDHGASIMTVILSLLLITCTKHLGAIGMSGSYFGKLTPPSIGCISTEDGMLNCSHSLLSNCQGDDATYVVCQCKHSIAKAHLSN